MRSGGTPSRSISAMKPSRPRCTISACHMACTKAKRLGGSGAIALRVVALRMGDSVVI